MVLALVFSMVGVAWAITVSERPGGIATPKWYGYSNGAKSTYYLEHPTLTANDQVVTEDTAQTLTNKTLTSPTITGASLSGNVSGAVLTTPQINDTSANHQYVFAPSELAADRTVTLPLLTGADEFVFKDFIQTLTNKTLTSPVINVPTTTSGNGAIVASKCTVVEYGDGVLHKSVITFTLTGDHDIDVDDGGKSAGVKVFDMPEGRLSVLGVTIDASTVTNNVYNASTNDIYYVSVGTVDGTQAADADLTSTEADIIPKTTLDTVSSTTLTLTWKTALAAAAQFDGTTTPVDLFVNVAVPDASNTDATTHAITGTMTITWINLGDY